MNRLRYTLAELLAEANAVGSYPFPRSEREWADVRAVGRELLVEDLQSAEAAHAYLAQVERTGDTAHIDHARKIAAQTRGC